ncbi:hypothetical protein skT53_03750 [Effusibacillus dendaii]|uniref:Uncharacterized protein n=1 Tax=Effusibacillus dendaii TaxID=2743772 RepID=A0A7I8DA39_9BACL|nr:hypothetical protein skT53_03750 [Effusibacillus dendaii]
MNGLKIRCNDCYEENDLENDRCVRCGRLLEDARKDQTRSKFDIQHYDAPNVIRKNTDSKKVW